MTRTPRDVPDTELAVLQVLWEHGPSTRRQIADILYPAAGASGYGTVQKLLERLQTKGYVRRDGSPELWHFSATLDRDELIARRLREVVDTLCGGSLAPLLMNLTRARPLSEGDLEELRAFLRTQQQEGQS